MESVLTRPVVERRGSLSPPKSPEQFSAPIDMPDAKGGLKLSQRKVRQVGVLGTVEGIRPGEEALQAFVKQVTGKNPERIKVKPDDSFVVGEAHQLIEARLLFEEKSIHLEGWSPQPDPKRMVFQKRLLKVNLPKLREEFVDMAEDLVAALGVLYIAPSKEDLWKVNREQSFVVKVDAAKILALGILYYS